MTAKWAALAVVLLAGAGAGASSVDTHAKRSVLVWLNGDVSGLESLARHSDLPDVVSPAVWRPHVAADGTVELRPWHDTIRVDATRLDVGRPVFSLVGCTRTCGASISSVLADPARRAAHVRLLVERARRDDVRGLLIDYEELSVAAGVFTPFVDELATALHRDGRIVGVAVPEPCGRSADCRRSRSPFDLGALARVADLLAIMAYDHALDGTAPVAPEAWLRAGLRRTRALVAPEHLHKVTVGLPLFGRAERSLFGGDNSVLWSQLASGIVKGVHVTVTEDRFEPSALSRRARLVLPDGRSGAVFYEDHESLAARLRVVEEEGFHSVALWRIGGEDPLVWDVLRRWKATKPLERPDAQR